MSVVRNNEWVHRWVRRGVLSCFVKNDALRPTFWTYRRALGRQASGSRPKLDTSSYTEMIGPYGLRRVDYSKPPRSWPRPPPPPPSTKATERHFPLFLAAIATACGIWIYFTQDETVYEYWKQVERGNVPLDGFGDDEEEDDDEDEWEDSK